MDHCVFFTFILLVTSTMFSAHSNAVDWKGPLQMHLPGRLLMAEHHQPILGIHRRDKRDSEEPTTDKPKKKGPEGFGNRSRYCKMFNCLSNRAAVMPRTGDPPPTRCPKGHRFDRKTNQCGRMTRS